jgi:hypothetical protein
MDNPARVMPRIVIRCPTTGTVVPTGLTTEQIKFNSLAGITMPVECPACHRLHQWKRKDAWVEKEKQDE